MIKASSSKQSSCLFAHDYFMFLMVIVLMATSCKQETEFDGFADHTYNQLSTDIKIGNDSLGIDPFLAEKYISLTAKEHRLLLHARINGLYEFKGVALPESDNPAIGTLDSSIRKIIFDCSYTNYFYGYASAIQTNAGTLVVAEKRVSETKVNSFSDKFLIIKSANGDWTTTDFARYGPYGFSWNGTRPLIGKTASGKIVMKGNGLYISDGDLQKWKHFPYAFQDLISSGKNYKDYGPVMTYSSKFGLFFGTGQVSSDTAAAVPIALGALFSVDADNGKVNLAKSRWVPKFMRTDSTLVYLPLMEYPVFYSVEHPDFSTHKYDVVGFALNADKIYQFVYNYKTGDTFDSIRFHMSKTNIVGQLIRESPVCIDYNPFTKRFELLASSPYQLDLYSIATDDLLSNKVNRINVAEWRLDATLLVRDVTIRAQGLYAVSSIIDEIKNTQTVYFHAGQEYPARSGIFMLTRTLDTPKLSQFVSSYRNYLQHALY